MSIHNNDHNTDTELDSSETETDDMQPLRHRTRFVPLLVALVLIVLIIGGFFAVRSFGGGLFASSATPTPTVPAGANLFYIVANPGYGSISIDGHAVSHLPAPGQAPLQLSPGSHTISWNVSPFPVVHCFVDVPPQLTGSSSGCDDTQSATVKVGSNAGQQATIIALTASGNNLSSTQQASLVSAVQAYFHTFQTSDTIQTGESYASLQASHNIATATQPLTATMQVQVDTNPNSTQPCFNDSGTGTPSCSVSSVNCHEFCPLSSINSNLPTSANWQVGVPVKITWNYTTSSGHMVAQNEPDAADSTSYEDIVPLSITWNGSAWQFTNLTGSTTPSLYQFTSNPICTAAQDWIKEIRCSKTLTEQHSTDRKWR